MKKSNKCISLLAAVLTAGSLIACGSAAPTESAKPTESVTPTDSATPAEHSSLSIVTTIFPEYDWLLNVLGDNPAGADVTLLLDNGVDLHSYQPAAEDILKISTCDLFIYVGGESDDWVDDALEKAVNKDMIVLNLLDILGESVKAEEIVEGMQGTGHDHDHEEGEDHDHEEAEDHNHEEREIEYDEHVWLSLKNACVLVNSFADALVSLDPANTDTYKTNAAAYTEKLDALDKEYTKTVETAATKTLLFGDRFPFRYLTDDYGLTYYAAFVGCSAETEASFETISFLAQKVDELSLRAIMTIEGNDHRIAETIAASTASKDQKILTLDSMQATTAKDIASGTTYLSVMESNLRVLKEALN